MCKHTYTYTHTHTHVYTCTCACTHIILHSHGFIMLKSYSLINRCFEIYPDPVMPEITYFCLPQLLPVLKNLGTYMQEVNYVRHSRILKSTAYMHVQTDTQTHTHTHKHAHRCIHVHTHTQVHCILFFKLF